MLVNLGRELRQCEVEAAAPQTSSTPITMIAYSVPARRLVSITCIALFPLFLSPLISVLVDANISVSPMTLFLHLHFGPELLQWQTMPLKKCDCIKLLR